MAGHHNIVDWRANTEAMTPVLDQGQCSSCWAVAFTDFIWIMSKFKEIPGNILLSAQELLDHVNESGEGCHGGDIEQAFIYLKECGLSSDEDYPYVMVKDATRMVADKKYRLASYWKIYKGDEDELLRVLDKHPLIVNIRCAQDIGDLSKNGVYEFEGGQDRHHVFILMGHGVEDENAQVLKHYWLVKSTWGDRWADGGYGKLRRTPGEVPFKSFYPEFHLEMFTKPILRRH